MEHTGEGARVSEGLFLEAQLMVLNMLSSTKPDCNPQGIWDLELNMIPSKNPQRGCSHPLSSVFRGPLLRGLGGWSVELVKTCLCLAREENEWMICRTVAFVEVDGSWG